MTPLRALPLAVVDIESTALPGPGAHVVQVAVVHHTLGSGADPVVAFSSLVKPPVPIRNTEIHGIDDAKVSFAPTWEDVAGSVEAAVASRTLVAFNAPADHSFIATEQARIGRLPPAFPWLCLLVLRRALVAKGAPGKLTKVCADYGIKLDPHAAAGDAVATARLVTPMMIDGWARTVYQARTIEDYFVWQRTAVLRQEVRWQAYCHDRGFQVAPDHPWHALYGVTPPAWTPKPPTPKPCVTCRAPVVLHVGRDGETTPTNPDGTPHACASAA